MDMSAIMEKYNAGEITREEANAQLKEIGANITLKERTEEELKAKKQREYEEGFIDIGKKPLNLPPRPDMKRNKALAGQVVEQITKQGKFAVTYNEDGYAVSAKRV